MRTITTDISEYTGYQHPDYAQSLEEIGTPRKLIHSNGWVIERSIPGTHHYDAMGSYPLFQCHDWGRIPDDLQELRKHGLVSLVMISDPMLHESDRQIFSHFDVARPFKKHYLSDLERPYEQSVSRHHRYYVRKATKILDIDIPERPLDHLDEWCTLYGHLMKRHGCRDVRTFSREGFRRLLAMPDVILFRAIRGGDIIGAQIVLLSGEVAHIHLAAFTPEGYKNGASYFLDWHAMEYLRGRTRYMNLGGGAGSDDTDGLARYKQGWSSEHRTTYLLGAVLNKTIYQQLGGNGYRGSDYFPHYRAGEYS